MICSLLFLVKARVDRIAAARCLAMELGSRLALIADFFAARFSRAVDSIGPESSYPCRICFELVTADSVAAVAEAALAFVLDAVSTARSSF